MKVQRINPPGIHKPRGYSHLVIGGDSVYIAGQISLDLDRNVIGIGNAYVQATTIWENIEYALSTIGSCLQNLLKVNIYVVGVENVPQVREVCMGIWARDVHPASTLVVVSALATEELLVEIEGVACISDSSK